MNPEPARLAPSDALALGFLGIRTRRARAALSALGISIGIATMIVVTGIPASSHAALDRDLAALGPNLLRVAALPDQEPPVRLPVESERMTARIAPVTAVSAVANTHTVIRRSDRLDPYDSSGLTVLATRPNLTDVLDVRVVHGRWLDPVAETMPLVVLGAEAAIRLGLTGAGAIGAQVIVAERWFTVIGVLAPVPLSPEIDSGALVGWGTATATLGFDGHPTLLYLRAQEDFVEDVRGVLPATVHPQDPGVVLVSRPSDALAAKRAARNTFSALLSGLAVVSLLVGGIGVANTMVISVLERRPEIGLRRALGATRGQIRGQFLTEAVVLSACGGVIGSATGLLACLGYALAQGWPPVVPTGALAAGLAGSVAVGGLAGIYPSVRAARMTPTQALART